MANDDRLFKFLQKCNRHYDTPDLHSFTADIKDGVVYVECRGDEIYIKCALIDANGHAKRTQWAGPIVAAANRLEMLGIDFDTIDM